MNRLILSQPAQHPLKRYTVVCITDQFHCEKLIRAGRLIADLSKTALAAVNVSSPDLTKNDAKALEYLFQISKENGAEMTVLYADKPLQELEKFIHERKAKNVVTGVAAQKESMLPELWKKCTDVQFFTVKKDGSFSETEEPSFIA
ncbi:MAG: hypothetical protein HFK04_04945 [Oscillospiraceae bacterium]|nr:hypothetical protein [Oscillospiraceae bacterium]